MSVIKNKIGSSIKGIFLLLVNGCCSLRRMKNTIIVGTSTQLLFNATLTRRTVRLIRIWSRLRTKYRTQINDRGRKNQATNFDEEKRLLDVINSSATSRCRFLDKCKSFIDLKLNRTHIFNLSTNFQLFNKVFSLIRFSHKSNQICTFDKLFYLSFLLFFCFFKSFSREEKNVVYPRVKDGAILFFTSVKRLIIQFRGDICSLSTPPLFVYTRTEQEKTFIGEETQSNRMEISIQFDCE